MLTEAGDIEDNWKEGGVNRVLMHAGIGLLTGGAGGAAGAAASAASTPYLNELLTDANTPEPVRQGLLIGTGMLIGGAVGGQSGAATGTNEVGNNALGRVVRAVGLGGVMACLKNAACLNTTGANGVAILAAVEIARKNNPGISEDGAFAIGITDVLGDLLFGKPSTSPLVPNHTGGDQIRDPKPEDNNTGGDQILDPKPGDNNTGGNQILDPKPGDNGTGGKPLEQPKPGDNIIITPVTDPLPGTEILLNEGNDGGVNVGGDSPISGNNVPPRVFTSGDPLVGQTATNIEKFLPGSVRDVNVPIKNDAIGKNSDADIMLKNGDVIEVKSGGGKGATSQVSNQSQIIGDSGEVIVYGPDLKPSVVKGIQRSGTKVFSNLDDLISYIKSKGL
jgi:hypothetical protein